MADNNENEKSIRSTWQKLAQKHGWGEGIDASISLQTSVLKFLGVDMNKPLEFKAFCPAVAHALQIQTTLRKTIVARDAQPAGEPARPRSQTTRTSFRVTKARENLPRDPREAAVQLMRSNVTMMEAIVCMDPVGIESLSAFLSDQGVRISKQRLLDLLADEGVAIAYTSARKRRRGGPKPPEQGADCSNKE